MLLAVLQLPVDVVEHQQLAPAVLQQLHLVAHLQHRQSRAADAPAHVDAAQEPGLHPHQVIPSLKRGRGQPQSHPSAAL